MSNTLHRDVKVPMELRGALRTGISLLREKQVTSYTLAAELLLLHVLGRDRAWLYAHPEEAISSQELDKFLCLIDRRANGEPTQHLTGKQEFWSLEFEVTPDVLIPRPETEHVIEVALGRLALRELRAGRPQKTNGEGFLIADIGTGSGCLAIALAKELPGATIYATDISSAALAVARRNAERHKVADRIHFLESDLALTLSVNGAAESAFDLIVSNPPYIPRRDAHTLAREVRDHEPVIALYGGEEGYELYAGLIALARRYLKPGGIFVAELGHDSLPAVQPLLDTREWTAVGVSNDLAGIPRVIAAGRSPQK
ncbi:MAG: release factor glutamine methyltransferase [Acidobacteriaceae bacterium]|jgi:release factor glutamine methyltransferase|nr:release factor glutamine methyltransferase [Acidobacteriaceae bacterium]